MDAKEFFAKDFARIRRKIDKFNKDLKEYVNATESDLVPEIDSTIIGYSSMFPIKVEETYKGIRYTEDDGAFWKDIEVVCEDAELWLSGEAELDDLLAYNRRRLRKGWRVWKSDNPDVELEKDSD